MGLYSEDIDEMTSREEDRYYREATNGSKETLQRSSPRDCLYVNTDISETSMGRNVRPPIETTYGSEETC